MKILVCEDDVYIGDLIETILKTEYEVKRAYSGTEALLLFNQERFDLVILDLMLPGLKGEEVLRQIKGRAKVIVVSAKSTKQDVIQNLLSGADDYITKPFDNDELLARVAVQLRRKDVEVKRLVDNELVVDLSDYQVYVKGNPVKLTKLEFGILVFLMQHPNQVFTKNQIFEQVWQFDALGNEDSVKVHVSNLRKKLGEYSDRKFIDTIWGIGFKYNKA